MSKTPTVRFVGVDSVMRFTVARYQRGVQWVVGYQEEVHGATIVESSNEMSELGIRARLSKATFESPAWDRRSLLI